LCSRALAIVEDSLRESVCCSKLLAFTISSCRVIFQKLVSMNVDVPLESGIPIPFEMGIVVGAEI